MELLPSTSIRDYAQQERAFPTLIAICDVIHHVPRSAQRQFFSDLSVLVGPETQLMIKDVRPGTPRAFLAYCADRYISGDKQVGFLHEQAIEELVGGSLPHLRARRTSLIEVDSPNFSILFSPA